MNLSHPLLDTVFTTGGTYIPAVTIENKSFFRSFLEDIRKQIEGLSGEMVLSDKEKILDLSKNAEMIDSYLTFTINRKNLLTKINAALDKIAVSEELYMKSAEIVSAVEQYMAQLADHFVCDLEFSKINTSSIIKMAGVSVRDEYDDPLERIIDYMELVREFDREKIFIFVNMRAYYSDEEMNLFYDTVIGHGFHIFMVDSFNVNKLQLEKRLIIDQDLCEI